MKIEIIESSTSGMSQVVLSHGDMSSMWDVSAYARTRDKAESLDTNKIFAEINAYWAHKTPERQKAIWEVYVKIREILDNNFDILSIQHKLQKLVKQLYDLMPLADIRHWQLFHSNVRIPHTLKDEYGEGEAVARTYLRPDYIELVSLAIALRPMVPIWGEYIGSTKKIVGNTDKELQAMRLMYYTDLVKSAPMERLKQFVTASVNHTLEGGPTATVMLGGLGSAELPDWVLALTAVRRLSVGEISPQDDLSNIITNVYQFISNNLKSMDRKFGAGFGGKVSEKNQITGSGGDEAHASVVEMYKVKQEVPDGDLVTLNVYSRQVHEMAIRIDETVDPALVTRCVDYVSALEIHPIQTHQVVLCQWVMAPVLTAKGIPLLTKASLLRVIAVTQALLSHWGFHDLAVLVSATPLVNGKDSMIGALESRGRIPRENMEDLAKIYPHHPPSRGKQATVRQQNVGAKAIDALCDHVAGNDWQLHAPPELIAASSHLVNTKKLIVPADIRAHLARLIITRIATQRG